MPVKAGKREAQPALALVRGIVRRNHEALIAEAFPGKRHETIRGPVAVPGGRTFQQCPAAVTHDRLSNYGQKQIVKMNQVRVDWFLGGATKVRRNSVSFPLELSLMEEPEAGREECDGCRCLVNSAWKRDRRARLVVVFEKAGQFVLIVQACPKVLADRFRFPGAQAVVEAFIV